MRQVIFLSMIVIWAQACNLTPCDASRERDLGVLEHSKAMIDHVAPRDDYLTYKSEDKSILLRHRDADSASLRANSHEICRSVNIYPYTAYAYYTYDNIDQSYITDNIVLTIEPRIMMEDGSRKESIYINLSSGVSASIKARVPIVGIDRSVQYEPYDELMEYDETLTLSGKSIKDVWSYERGDIGMYYTATSGVVAIMLDNIVYVKE